MNSFCQLLLKAWLEIRLTDNLEKKISTFHEDIDPKPHKKQNYWDQTTEVSHFFFIEWFYNFQPIKLIYPPPPPQLIGKFKKQSKL